MKLNRKRDFGKSGIYAIKNIKDGKIYVGKAKCIYTRIHTHITKLRSKHKDENRHLIYAWHKYGEDSFEYMVLEYTELNEDILKERELYWQEYYKVTTHGYNFRKDSSTGMICHPETRKKMSESHKKRYLNPKEREKCSHDFWKKNPDKLKKMAEKISQLNVKYSIDQFDKKTGQFIKRWSSIIELMKAHPEYKKHNIYAVCSGEKPSMYGFIWKKVSNDIVQSS